MRSATAVACIGMSEIGGIAIAFAACFAESPNSAGRLALSAILVIIIGLPSVQVDVL